MQKKSVLILQSNYIPWKGYFSSIDTVDTFVVYDEMQYTKRDWRNRNIIKTQAGPKWLTIPVEVSGKYNQKIKDTKVADADWNRKHWLTLKNEYKNAAAFKEVEDWIQGLYETCNHAFLTDINLHFIRAINDFLGIKTEIVSSSDFILADDRNQRLVDICTKLGATDYYSGPAAKAYMDLNLFKEAGLNVHFFRYDYHAEYPQLHPPFLHGVSILDLILNMGHTSKDLFKIKA